MNRDVLITQLKIDEGLRLQPYTDSLGFVTIGYGHKGVADVMLHGATGITQEYAEQILERDVDSHSKDLQIHLPWMVDLNDARQDALVNMAFNLGIPHLLEFIKFLAALKAGDFDTAAAEMLNSTWATQVGARAIRLANVVRSGVELTEEIA